MKLLLRPSVLIAVSLALIVGAVAVWIRFRPEPTGPTPLPVAPGDREIVWLYQATSTATWERFVTAVKLTEERLRDELPGIKAVIDDKAFPSQSTAVPEVALTWDGAGGRIVFRWYKLTSDWKARDWVPALLKDRPPPLAIIGGSSSDGARDLAVQLRAATADLAVEQRPLLLLTTATADLVDWPADQPQPADLSFRDPVASGQPPRVSLEAIYPQRTFRFCFSNRQMSEAVTQFVWSREELRPDFEHVYMVQWKDDTYSRDLVDGFVVSSGRVLGENASFNVQEVLSSFGTYQAANRLELLCVGALLTDLTNAGGLPTPILRDGKRKRSLLVVAGQTLPTRRFLRELARTEPRATRSLIVATGDSLSFNTVYRDRDVTWPIQDLPFALALFSHANPVDESAGFKPHAEGRVGTSTVGDSGATGTEDVLLFADIVGMAARGSASRDGPLGDAPRLAERLHAARYSAGRISFGEEGTPLFGKGGNREGGTGEHVVCLLPQFQGARALARASIEVWTWRDNGAGRVWERCCEPLTVSYE